MEQDPLGRIQGITSNKIPALAMFHQVLEMSPTSPSRREHRNSPMKFEFHNSSLGSPVLPQFPSAFPRFFSWSLVPGRSQDLPSVGDPIVLQMMVTPKHPTPAVQTHEWLMPHHGDPGPKYWLRRASPQPPSTRYR